MNVDWPSIMIALDGIDTDLRACKNRLDSLCNVESGITYLFVVVCPDDVSRIVTSPEEHIWLDVIFNKVQHAIETNCWNITLIFAKWTSLSRGVSWEPVICSAA